MSFLRVRKTPVSRSLCLALVLLIGTQVVLAQESPRDILTRMWQAASGQEALEARNALDEAVPDIDDLYTLLSEGPNFSADVQTGVWQSFRRGAGGHEYPFVVIVPETYDPARSYPVEFMLHGGVGRQKPAEGDSWWRSGYDSLKREDRIVVVPAAWVEAFWWHENQAENLPAILRRVKQLYNVDDNRVSMTGVSDGGTGAYFYAFKQPSEWSTFLPYIGHPGVLRNSQSGGGYRLYFENLMTKPLFIVNGENDRLYPASSVQPFIDVLEQANIRHTFRVIEGGGHNTNWLPAEGHAIEAFKNAYPRNPFPEILRWVSDRTDKFNQLHWIRTDELEEDGQPGLLQVERDDNTFTARADGVSRFSLFLNPENVDFSAPITVIVNESTVFEGLVEQNREVILSNLIRNLDRKSLVTAELNIDVP